MSATEDKRIVEMIELIGSTVLFTQLAISGLILALAEKKALEPERVFAFYRTLAEAMETRPGTMNAAKTSARMLREIETMARNMTTIPQGAGRA